MNKIAIVVLTDTKSHESMGRLVNALEFAKELQENGDDATIVFDGAGTRWIPELESEDHKAHPLYAAVKDNIKGACRYCAKAFGVYKEIKETNVPLLDEYDQHPSLRKLVVNGYQVVTF